MTQQTLPSQRALIVRSISRPVVMGIVAGAVATIVMPSSRTA